MTDAIEKKPEQTSALKQAEEQFEDEFEIESGEDLEEFLGKALAKPGEDSDRYAPYKFDAQRQRVFIEEYIKTGVKAEARRCSGIIHHTVKMAEERSPQFAMVLREAEEIVAGKLEREAIRRASEGYERPVFQKGQEVGTETVYSDGLLKFLLRGLKPEKFRKGAEEQAGVHVEINMNAPDTYDETEIEADKVE